MSSGVGALSGAVRKKRWVNWLDSHGWLPTWSPVAAQRAVRATLVAPSVFAFCDLVIGNHQTALFGAFGSLATLIFAGTRREKLVAHTMLALIVIGTAVNGSVVTAALVSVPVAFAVFFAGVFGATAAAGVTAALLAYVLPAASPGTMSMVPDRLAGWWIASVAGTAAVLIIYTPPGGNTLRGAASKLAGELARVIDSVLADGATEEQLEAAVDTKRELLTAGPWCFRPPAVRPRRSCRRSGRPDWQGSTGGASSPGKIIAREPYLAHEPEMANAHQVAMAPD